MRTAREEHPAQPDEKRWCSRWCSSHPLTDLSRKINAQADQASSVHIRNVFRLSRPIQNSEIQNLLSTDMKFKNVLDMGLFQFRGAELVSSAHLKHLKYEQLLVPRIPDGSGKFSLYWIYLNTSEVSKNQCFPLPVKKIIGGVVSPRSS